MDVLGAVDWLFPGGMNHHTLMTGSRLLNQVVSKVVRQLSGLGKLPDPRGEDKDSIPGNTKARPSTAAESPSLLQRAKTVASGLNGAFEPGCQIAQSDLRAGDNRPRLILHRALERGG